MHRVVVLMIFSFFMVSFVKNPELEVKYELSLVAKGCHFQVMVNEKMVMDGKSYQMVTRNLNINKELIDSGDQKIDVKMIRISREMPLKSTQAYVNLKLEKISGDSTELIKEVKLPTFPYDDDEVQPHSIGGSIEFQKE
ncbi:hypothetical protein [Moheibacter lacus]|uniref:Uncharacterized protein n=1 Tax=Moheibacter lacus TaxID=2745851 RepID=A0A838ZNC8_9FLAO|nr:hypothetical protein [Moheibacter lacus]MBA5628717.1 hypothetical protein [Moheibacter lacus]